MTEKRGFTRYEMLIQSNIFYYQNNDHGRWARAVTKNISSRGAFFYTETPLPEGTTVRVELVLPISNLGASIGNDSMIECSGAVIRVESEGMAVCFDKSCRITPFNGNGA